MFLSNDNNLIMEQFTPPSDDYGMGQSDSEDVTPQVEFQNVKTFILYNKYSLLKSKIKVYISIEQDPEKLELLSQLYDFINLIQLYFNTLEYDQLIVLLDNITNELASFYSIPVESLNVDPDEQEKSENDENLEEPQEQKSDNSEIS